MNQKVKHFKKPTQVWWLSTHEAVEAIYSVWTLLILSLEHEAASSNNNGAAKARGMILKIESFVLLQPLASFLLYLVLTNKYSKVFQTDMIDRLNAINARSNCVNDQRHERQIILVSIWKNCFSTWK